MKLKLTAAEKTLLLSISFTLLLLAVRFFYTNDTAYLFYPWNLFLAVIPIWFSRRLNNCHAVNRKSILLIAGWLLFFPNAPYVITDIFHFHQRGSVPPWYDLLLVFSAAWNGLTAGIISLMYVDEFISRYATKKWRVTLTVLFLFAASNGVYLGRFLRFNSWDVFTKPFSLAHYAGAYVIKPFHHTHAWAFSFICTGLLLLVYYSIKNFQVAVKTSVDN